MTHLAGIHLGGGHAGISPTPGDEAERSLHLMGLWVFEENPWLFSELLLAGVAKVPEDQWLWLFKTVVKEIDGEESFGQSKHGRVGFVNAALL